MIRVLILFFFVIYGECVWGQENYGEFNCDAFKLNSHMKRFVKEKLGSERDAPYVFPVEDSLRGMDSINLSYILLNIDNETNGTVVFELTENWAAIHISEILTPLVSRLDNIKEVGFDEDGMIVVNERYVKMGMVVIANHGVKEKDIIYTDDDIYKIAGRANFLLKRITGEDFGNVNIESSEKELEVLKDKWVNWLSSRCIP